MCSKIRAEAEAWPQYKKGLSELLLYPLLFTVDNYQPPHSLYIYVHRIISEHGYCNNWVPVHRV